MTLISMIVAFIGLSAAIVCFVLYHMNARMNMDLAAYTLFLLLSDEGVQDHQRKITSFVRQLDEPDAVNRVLIAERAVQSMADDMARGLTRGGFLTALSAKIRDVRGEHST